MITTKFTRKDYNSLISAFKEKTKKYKFNRPEISCIFDIRDDDKLPESFIIAAYSSNDVDFNEITSIYVFKSENSDEFILDAQDMNGVSIRFADNIDSIFKEAKEMIEEINS